MSTDLTKQLNPAQIRAVEHEDGHLLIIAGPGTGKTHTLTHRIAHVLGRLEGDQKVLAITFTNKAAQEMRERLLSRHPSIERSVTVGTFHGFCLELLRERIGQTNLPENFRVASPTEIRQIMREAWDVADKDLTKILEYISQWKSFGPGQIKPPRLKSYNECLRTRKLVDFDDLLHETMILLRNNERVTAEVRRRYPFICVDEYQDLNAIQHAFLKEVVDDSVHLTAIGDPNQAIYGFRGSDVRFFHRFNDDFQPATVMMLNENYRSTPNLLAASSQVIGGQSLQAIADIQAQGRLVVYQAPTDKAEAEYVVHQIENLVGGTSLFSRDSGRVKREAAASCGFGDIAVLYRLNAQRHLLKQAFERSGIPYQICGEDPPVISLEIMDLIRRQIIDPSDTAATALKRFEDTPEGRAKMAEDEQWRMQWLRLKRLASSSPCLDQFFDRLALEQPEDGFEFHVEKVSLMTLHASKGLEFPVVFVVGCEEGLLPLNIAGMISNRDEERRLFYVGMTRAKEHLYFTRAQRRMLFGQTLDQPPSKFLDDIKEDLKAYESHVAKRREIKKSDDEQFTLF